MKFSIIVPVYNAEKYINKLVDSVINQTYQDYELILVDDGSKDNSYSVIKGFEEKNSKIKAYTKENTGPGLTRKFGFERSTGDLLFFVDSDDWITSPDSLEEIAKIFSDHPDCDVLFFDREDIIGEQKSVIKGYEQISEGLHKISEINEVVRPGLGAKILKKEILTPNMFIESKIFEDLYTTYEYLDCCDNFYYVNRSYYSIYHDLESDSLSSSEDAGAFYKSIDMILMIYKRATKPALRYSLELRMATIFTYYWKARLRRVEGYSSKEMSAQINRIVSVLKSNNVVIKPTGKKLIKIIIYKMLLLMSGGRHGEETN